MFYETFKDFEATVRTLINKGYYDEALHILNGSHELLPKHKYEENCSEIMILIAIVYSKQLKVDECISLIKYTISKNMPLSLDYKIFDFIREHKEYKAVYQINKVALEAAKESSSFKYKVFLPEGYDANNKYPLFICLHGDGDYIGYHCSYWKPDVFLQNGYIVVYPQSSQLYSYNNFGWMRDPLLARQEIKSCYIQLLKDYSIDIYNVLIGGFSGGAFASLDIALSHTIPTKGFIALCLDSTPTAFMELAKSAASTGIRGVILEGQDNTYPGIQDMLEAFRKADLPYRYMVSKNTSHFYPVDLDEKLIESIEFIAG